MWYSKKAPKCNPKWQSMLLAKIQKVEDGQTGGGMVGPINTEGGGFDTY